MLLGAPVEASPLRWRMARSVVAGPLVNGFSKRDWVLGIVYRSGKAFIGVRIQLSFVVNLCVCSRCST